MLVGVGVALAKTERERRAAARARRPRRASLSLTGDEQRAAGLRRIVLEQLDRAIELLEDPQAMPGRETVHEVRKIIKRVRAIVRLLRGELGTKRFAREDAALGDCARRLAGARDAEVMLDTLDALCRRDPKLARHPGAAREGKSARGGKAAKRREGVEALRAQLVAGRDAASAGEDRVLRGATVADLHAIRARVARWDLRERPRDPTRLLSPGIERLYRDGRRRMRRARRRGGAEAMHAWRKRVKALRYVAETLDRGGEWRKTKGGKRLRRVARRADRIAELLGEEHDLALLARMVRERAELFAGERKQRKRLLRAIAKRRRQLRERALLEGEHLYERKPKAFVRRVRKAL